MAQTTRWQIPTPELTGGSGAEAGAPPDVPARMKDMADRIDGLLSPFRSGLLADRGTAGKPGQRYRDENGIIWLDIGADWVNEFGYTPPDEYINKTWSLNGDVVVETTADYGTFLMAERLRVAAGWRYELYAAYGELWAPVATGSSYTFQVLRRANGGGEAVLTGWTNLEVTSNASGSNANGTEFNVVAGTRPAAQLNDKDRYRPKITAVASGGGTPKAGFITLTLRKFWVGV